MKEYLIESVLELQRGTYLCQELVEADILVMVWDAALFRLIDYTHITYVNKKPHSLGKLNTHPSFCCM